MAAGLGFWQPWRPHNLGAALIYAADPGDVNCAPDDGTGKVATLKHLYDPTKFLQSPSGFRPVINAAGGATANKRVLNLGPGNYLRANGAHVGLTSMFDGALNSTSGSLILAVKLLQSSTQWSEPFVWVNGNGVGANPNDQWIHLHQRDTAVWFRVHDAAAVEGVAIDAAGRTGWFLYSCIKSGSVVSIRVNGSQVGITPYSGSGTFIGADFLMNATLFNGALYADPAAGDTGTQAIGGMVICNSALAGDALLNAEAWVKQTAGL